MVYKIQKRPTELYLTPVTSEENSRRSKSPSRATKMVTPTRTNSVERKFKLIKKKSSSKDKEQLLKGNVLEVKNDINNNNTCECSKSTATKNKNKAVNNKVWKNGKLFDAILDDDFARTRKLIIADEMDVNEYSPEGTSVLHLASAGGYLDCLELLLECGAKVNCADVNNRTPLEYAVIYGNFECAALLIENGADASVIRNGIN